MSGTNPERSSAPGDPSPYLAGEVIGDRYRLVRELGRGGMGVVWVAHSLVLGVDVALKLIRASTAGSGLATRMAREAHAAARLGHPALVRVFDFGWTSRGDPFLVMELVQGETLSAVLAREARLAAIRAVQMLLPIADGLRLAHDKNIIHRDIKPENIFLASDALGRKQPKLLDFGIAKIDPTPTDNKLTQVGVILGSPEYMSPEQACGDEVDERTDVWSLSVVLYESITGAVPFRKSNYNALMQAIIHDSPVPTTRQDAGDVALWHVIERGLAKQRHQRWTNMTELGEALALWLYEHGIKEDLSGNSIRAVWLDGTLSGVRPDLSTSQPGSAARGAMLTQPGDDDARHSLDSTQSIARSLFNRSRKRTVFSVLGLVLVGGAVAGALALRSKPPSDLPTTPPSSASEESALDRQPVSPPADSLPSRTTPPPASGEAAAAKEATAPANAPKPKAPRTNTAPPKPAARPAKPTHDFGF